MTNSSSPPTGEDVVRLREALAERLRNFTDDAILGAQLGTHLNTILAPNTYKSWLNEGNQNLRTFSEEFLYDIVKPTTERQGLDYLFQLKGKSHQVMQSFGGALWKAFCLTQPTQTISFKYETNTLYLTPIGFDNATEDPQINPISVAEHKTMCVEFIKTLDQESRNVLLLKNIAAGFEPHSYSIWVTALKMVPGRYKEWGLFRVANVKELFAQRVQLLKVDNTVRTRLTSEFNSDYASQRKTKPSSVTEQVAPTAVPATGSRTTDNAARHVLAKALEMLDDTQIAKILVPLDVVAALFAKRK